MGTDTSEGGEDKLDAGGGSNHHVGGTKAWFPVDSDSEPASQ